MSSSSMSDYNSSSIASITSSIASLSTESSVNSSKKREIFNKDNEKENIINNIKKSIVSFIIRNNVKEKLIHLTMKDNKIIDNIIENYFIKHNLNEKYKNMNLVSLKLNIKKGINNDVLIYLKDFEENDVIIKGNGLISLISKRYKKSCYKNPYEFKLFIDSLDDYIPRFLYSNKEIYGINTTKILLSNMNSIKNAIFNKIIEDNEPELKYSYNEFVKSCNKLNIKVPMTIKDYQQHLLETDSYRKNPKTGKIEYNYKVDVD